MLLEIVVRSFRMPLHVCTRLKQLFRTSTDTGIPWSGESFLLVLMFLLNFAFFIGRDVYYWEDKIFYYCSSGFCNTNITNCGLQLSWIARNYGYTFIVTTAIYALIVFGWKMHMDAVHISNLWEETKVLSINVFLEVVTMQTAQGTVTLQRERIENVRPKLDKLSRGIEEHTSTSLKLVTSYIFKGLMTLILSVYLCYCMYFLRDSLRCELDAGCSAYIPYPSLYENSRNYVSVLVFSAGVMLFIGIKLHGIQFGSIEYFMELHLKGSFLFRSLQNFLSVILLIVVFLCMISYISDFISLPFFFQNN